MNGPRAPSGAAPDLDRIITATCLHPGLHSLLLFDSTPTRLHAIAALMAERLAGILGAPVHLRTPNSGLDDDGLWGLNCLDIGANPRGAAAGIPPSVGAAGPLLLDRPSALLPDPAGPDWFLLLIPDLTRIGPAFVRAAYQIIGTETICLERYGSSLRIPNRTVWLAGCPRIEARRIPRHLLDRFTVQVGDPGLDPGRAAAVRAALEGSNSFGFAPLFNADTRPLKLPLPQISNWSFLLSIAGAIHRFGHVIHCTHPWERGRNPEVSAGSPQH